MTTINTMDNSRMIPQEDEDYITAVKVFNHIIPEKYGAIFSQMPIGSPSDMRFNLKTNRKFNVEIKQRFFDKSRYSTIPLKKGKLNGLKNDTKSDEKLLYIALVNNSEYYIFDLDNIDFSTANEVDYDSSVDYTSLTLADWTIKKVQYAVEDNTEYVTVPTYFIPLSMACASGIIPE